MLLHAVMGMYFNVLETEKGMREVAARTGYFGLVPRIGGSFQFKSAYLRGAASAEKN